MRRLVARLRGRGDDGMGLILVMGTATVVMALVTVTGAVAARSLNSGQTHDQFGAMGAVAETGVEQAIARVQAAYDKNGSDYVTPHATGTAFDPSPDCVANEADYAFPSGTLTAAQETAWAKSKLLTLATIPGCLHSSSRGEYVMMRPTGRQTVYAMAWSPKYDPGARARLIKSEYIFAPYKPAHAILTGGSLAIESSTDVDTVTGASGASVHSNGNITVAGNPTVSGEVSMSGSGALPSGGNFGGRSYSPKQTIPAINALALYGKEVGKYPGGWFDLCPGGDARIGSTSGVPCSGTLLGNYGPGSTLGKFRNGWTYDSSTTPGTWVATNIEDGIYYVSEGNVTNGNGNPSANKVTIIASSVSPATCNKTGGNIDWDHVNISVPYMTGLFMYADQDLLMTANLAIGSDAGTVASGSFVAGDQVELDTSSSKLYGSVIAADECDPAGSLVPDNLIKNPSVYFDPNGYTPLTDVVNTTLWLELTG